MGNRTLKNLSSEESSLNNWIETDFDLQFSQLGSEEFLRNSLPQSKKIRVCFNNICNNNYNGFHTATKHRERKEEAKNISKETRVNRQRNKEVKFIQGLNRTMKPDLENRILARTVTNRSSPYSGLVLYNLCGSDSVSDVAKREGEYVRGVVKKKIVSRFISSTRQ